jgi:FKBP-type peptidyl-prolyl cis-trans isomerase SlyD
MMLEARGPEGVSAVTVSEVTETTIVIDGNHPLAGKDLFFAIYVSDVRDATAEEKSHGHVHGPGGHHHH